MTKSQQKTAFGRIAKDYQKYRRTYEPKLYKLLFSLTSKKDLQILDIGCGTGKSTEALILQAGKHNVSVTGVDPDEMMLREARASAKKQKLPINYIQGTAEKLSFKNQFDAVITGSAFHWFGNKRALLKIKNTLKSDGVFFVFWTQTQRSEKPTIGHDVYVKYKYKGIPGPFRDQKFVSSLLSKAGFGKVQMASIFFNEKKTIPETIGMIKTNSAYALMSPAVRKQFVREMTRAYKIALGDKKYDFNKIELRVCYGFK